MIRDIVLWLLDLDGLEERTEKAEQSAEAAQRALFQAEQSAVAAQSALSQVTDLLMSIASLGLLITILFLVAPPIWRTLKWFILRKKSLRPVHFLDGGPGGPESIEIDVTHGKYAINLPKGHPGLFVRPGSWVQHPESTTFEAPHKAQLVWTRFKNDLYWLYRINSGAATLETPHHGAYIARILVPKGEKIVVKLRHVVAFSCNTFPLSTRRQYLNIPAYVQRLTKCTYFEGPAEFYVFGIDGIEERKLANQSVYLKSSAVIGWTPGLSLSVATQETLLASLVRRNGITQTCFTGDGVVLSQSLAGDMLDIENRTNGQSSSWWRLVMEILKPF